MVFCPDCGAENADSAKCCKNCGHTLSANRPIKDNYVNTGIDPSARVNDNSNSSNSNINSNSKSDNKNLIIICLTIVICALLIAGAMVMFSNNNANDNDSDALSDSASLNSGSVENVSSSETSAQATQENSPQIYRGSFSTGSSASDKTHCTVYVGSEHAGEKIKISVLYLNNGDALNQGKVVTKTVSRLQVQAHLITILMKHTSHYMIAMETFLTQKLYTYMRAVESKHSEGFRGKI